MPKKTGIIILIVFVMTVFITSSRIDIAHFFNQSKPMEEMMKKNPDSKVEYDPILETPDFIDAEDKDIKPGAETVREKSQIQDEIMGYRLKSKDRTKQVQEALKKAGFYKGDIDGKMGPQTKKAVKVFQKSKGLNPDGVVGIKTWEDLAKILKK